eukprot:12300064-Alexandrium_andersonii.AAC.1
MDLAGDMCESRQGDVHGSARNRNSALLRRWTALFSPWDADRVLSDDVAGSAAISQAAGAAATGIDGEAAVCERSS